MPASWVLENPYASSAWAFQRDREPSGADSAPQALGGPRKIPVRVWVAATVLLSIHGGLLAYSAVRHSPTLLEPASLAAGLSHWQFGRFELHRVNPPLVRMVGALPVLVAGYRADWRQFHEGPGARPEFEIGRAFIAANGERSVLLLRLARWMCIPFSIAGGLFCFCWAREVWGGSRAGLLALTLWCFDPNILAHGQLITTDVAATGFGVGAGYFFWRWLARPMWGRALTAGVLLGLAAATKMTWLVLFVLWPLLWLICIWRTGLPAGPESDFKLHGSHDNFPRQLGQIGLLLGAALYFVNLAYAFDGSLSRLGSFTFISTLLTGHAHGEPGNRFSGCLLEDLPVPLPEQYVLGFDEQRCDLESFGGRSYLGGQWKQGGWWYYYLYALAVKMPHGTQSLFAMALVSALICRRRMQLRDSLAMFAPAIVLLIVVSSQMAFNHHARYVLPALPFLFVFAGSISAVWDHCNRCVRSTCAAPLLLSVASTLVAYPHTLSYFNELSGGPSRGHRHLLHSNYDWGQDLLYLKEWLRHHSNDRPLSLLYYGYYDPADIGITYRLPSTLPGEDSSEPNAGAPRYCAVSAQIFHGMPWMALDREGQHHVYGADWLRDLRERIPLGRVGQTIYLFAVPQSKPSAAPASTAHVTGNRLPGTDLAEGLPGAHRTAKARSHAPEVGTDSAMTVRHMRQKP